MPQKTHHLFSSRFCGSSVWVFWSPGLLHGPAANFTLARCLCLGVQNLEHSAQGLMRPVIKLVCFHFLPHSVSQSKVTGPARFKGWGNKLCLPLGGAMCHKTKDVNRERLPISSSYPAAAGDSGSSSCRETLGNGGKHTA